MTEWGLVLKGKLNFRKFKFLHSTFSCYTQTLLKTISKSCKIERRQQHKGVFHSSLASLFPCTIQACGVSVQISLLTASLNRIWSGSICLHWSLSIPLPASFRFILLSASFFLTYPWSTPSQNFFLKGEPVPSISLWLVHLHSLGLSQASPKSSALGR